MTDIVERLRGRIEIGDGDDALELIRDALAEIERLREVEERYNEVCSAAEDRKFE